MSRTHEDIEDEIEEVEPLSDWDRSGEAMGLAARMKEIGLRSIVLEDNGGSFEWEEEK